MTYSIIIFIFINFISLLLLVKIAFKLNLIDIPNKRKIHKKPVPYIGGLSISICFLFSLIFFPNFPDDLSLIISIAFLITLVGFIDDKFKLNAGNKLTLQIIPIFYLIFFENMFLNTIGDYNTFNLNLSTFAIPFTFLCVLMLINAFNYFDGIDGSLVFSSFSVLAILFYLTTDNYIKIYLIVISLTLLVFLFFNFSLFKLPKIFLGDSGSLTLGFIFSFTLIYFANRELVHPIILAWAISIFVYEFISINLSRIINKKNIFSAGQDHLHHILLRRTKSILITNLLLSTINISLFIIGYNAYYFINALTSLIAFMVCFIIFFLIRYKYAN